jgi:hypothetical protein
VLISFAVLLFIELAAFLLSFPKLSPPPLFVVVLLPLVKLPFEEVYLG